MAADNNKKIYYQKNKTKLGGIGNNKIYESTHYRNKDLLCKKFFNRILIFPNGESEGRKKNNSGKYFDSI